MRTGWRQRWWWWWGGFVTIHAVHVRARVEAFPVRGGRVVEAVLLHGAVDVGRERRRVVGMRVAVAVALLLAQLLLHALRHVVDEHGATQEHFRVVNLAQLLDGHAQNAALLVSTLLRRVVEWRDALRARVNVVVVVICQQRQFTLQRRGRRAAAAAAVAVVVVAAGVVTWSWYTAAAAGPQTARSGGGATHADGGCTGTLKYARCTGPATCRCHSRCYHHVVRWEARIPWLGYGKLLQQARGVNGCWSARALPSYKHAIVQTTCQWNERRKCHSHSGSQKHTAVCNLECRG